MCKLRWEFFLLSFLCRKFAWKKMPHPTPPFITTTLSTGYWKSVVAPNNSPFGSQFTKTFFLFYALVKFLIRSLMSLWRLLRVSELEQEDNLTWIYWPKFTLIPLFYLLHFNVFMWDNLGGWWVGGWVGGQRHTPAALPQERQGFHCIGDWVGPRAGPDGFGKLRPLGFDPQTVQSLVSRYTDWANPTRLLGTNKQVLSPIFTAVMIMRASSNRH